jgi:hypothetical protein
VVLRDVFYTHHWSFHADAVFSEGEWSALLAALRALVRRAAAQGVQSGTAWVRRRHRDGLLLEEGASGLPGCTEAFWIDGGCETLFLPRHLSMVMPPGLTEERATPGSSIYHTDESVRTGVCKTDRLPYDALVTGGLCLLRHMFLDKVADVSSDGEAEDWVDGLELARSTLAELGHPGTPALPPALPVV